MSQANKKWGDSLDLIESISTILNVDLAGVNTVYDQVSSKLIEKAGSESRVDSGIIFRIEDPTSGLSIKNKNGIVLHAGPHWKISRKLLADVESTVTLYQRYFSGKDSGRNIIGNPMMDDLPVIPGSSMTFLYGYTEDHVGFDLMKYTPFNVFLAYGLKVFCLDVHNYIIGKSGKQVCFRPDCVIDKIDVTEEFKNH